MGRTENVELTVLCLIYDNDSYLLQDRVKEDWRGYTLQVMLEDDLSEFQYVVDGDEWKIVLN